MCIHMNTYEHTIYIILYDMYIYVCTHMCSIILYYIVYNKIYFIGIHFCFHISVYTHTYMNVSIVEKLLRWHNGNSACCIRLMRTGLELPGCL